jgi:hypothetical protein
MFAIALKQAIEPGELLLLQLAKQDVEPGQPRIRHAIIFDRLEHDPEGGVSRRLWPDAGRTWPWIIHGRAVVPTEPFSLEDLTLSRPYESQQNPIRIHPVDEALILPLIRWETDAQTVASADGHLQSTAPQRLAAESKRLRTRARGAPGPVDLRPGIRRLATRVVQNELADSDLGLDASERIALRSSIPEVPLRGRVGTIVEAVLEAVEPASFVAAKEWDERSARWANREKDLQARLETCGLSPAPSWSDGVLDKLVVAASEGDRALESAVVSHYRSDDGTELRLMAAGWMEDDSFRARRQIIDQGVRAHSEGRYLVSIPAILPQIEGIAVDVFAPGSNSVRLIEVVKKGLVPQLGLDDLVAGCLVRVLEMLWRSESFSILSTSGVASRHAILHGRMIKYGSEINSIRGFLALDLLASQSRTYRQQVSGPPGS